MTETIQTIFYDELISKGGVNSEQTVRAAFSRVMQELNRENNRKLVSASDKSDLDNIDTSREVAKENVPAVREIIKAVFNR